MHTLRVFDAVTGAALAWFPGHGASVYDIAWAPAIAGGVGESLATALYAAELDRGGGGAATHLMTASADGGARAWAVGGGAVVGGADDMVAQHACECYAAAWHPVTPGITASAARDGGVRLWRMPSAAGELASTRARQSHDPGHRYHSAPALAREATTLTGLVPYAGVAATALAFDSGGHRLFVGFADGVVREMQVDLGHDAGEPQTLHPKL
jgi:WD40 repeat protein